MDAREMQKSQGIEDFVSEDRMKKMRQVEVLNIEDLVPEHHLLRDVDKTINFSFVYDLVRNLYCTGKGCPTVDPVALFKIVLIQYMFGIRSMRLTIREIEVIMAHRWFWGYGMCERIPYFTTFVKNYLRRFVDINVLRRSSKSFYKKRWSAAL